MALFVQFGAGNIGRSLVAPIFTQAGYDVVFVDIQKNVIHTLNEKRSYKVRIKDSLPSGTPDTIHVTRVGGILATDAAAVASAVASADMIGTAVGLRALPAVVRTMAEGLKRRDRDITVLCCENDRNAAARAEASLAVALNGEKLRCAVRFAATSIGKMVPIMPKEIVEHDPLEVWAEAYATIVADAEAFTLPHPRIDGLELCGNFQAFVDRKLYIHNLGHAVAAYHGYLSGKTYIYQCMHDPLIEKRTRAAMQEASDALIARYPHEFNRENMNMHIDDLLHRFANVHLKDTVHRVGRDLQRKLGPHDRMIGALKLVAEQGGVPTEICRAIAAATKFGSRHTGHAEYADDNAFRKQIETAGIDAFLRDFCGLKSAAEQLLIKEIVAQSKPLECSE